MTVLFSLLAFCCLASAIDSSQPVAIGLVLVAWVLSLWATVPAAGGQSSSPRLLKAFLVLGTAQLTLTLAATPLIYSQLGRESRAVFLASTGVIGLLLADYAFDRSVTRRGRACVMLALYAGLGIWLIVSTPRPGIDVWHFQQNAAQTLLEGAHPYDISMPNPYSHTRFYGPGVVRDGRVFGFPYPPLSLLLTLPAYLVGDVRWIMLAAHLALAGTLLAIGRHRGFRAGHPVELVPLMLLTQPGSLFVISLAWTESLFAAAMGGLVWSCQMAKPTARWMLLGAAWSMKQYSVLLPWTQWQSGAFRLRDFVLAAIATGGLMLPFFLWNFEATWYSIVEFQFLQPTRPDSYSLNAVLLHGGREPLPTRFSLACVVAVAIWVGSTRSAIRTNIGLTSAVVLLTLFITTNAFINYLWAVTALLAIGIVVAFPADDAAADDVLLSAGTEPENVRGPTSIEAV